MKTIKRNTCKKPTSKNNEKQRLKNVANIMEAITDAIPDGSTIHDVVDALCGKMVQIKSATQVTDKAIGDIFQMECVREISKERLRHDSPFDVILPAGKSDHYYVFLYSGMLAEGTSRRIACSEFGDWICETYFGWMILTDEEYKEARG